MSTAGKFEGAGNEDIVPPKGSCECIGFQARADNAPRPRRALLRPRVRARGRRDLQ
ncbi:MAG TPA: hypothetical protein VFK05_28915 [Polyangiaceae bacterium]|nr:hypothetical protein [Polyangiaceae bacterium]